MENYLYPDHQIDFIGDAEKNMADFKWTDYVDKVYLLTIPKRMKRFIFAHNELNRLGIEDKDIMPYIGIQSPLYKYIYEKLYDDSGGPAPDGGRIRLLPEKYIRKKRCARSHQGPHEHPCLHG